MMRQWLDAKAKAKDAILLFRMGDFYELFADDALKAGEVLDLAVTTRDRDKGDDAMPMAGFPHPQAPVYIARLIAAGLKVAVCDQLEDPALARGIVKRDVTRIVTPGSVLDDESLDARANNFLVAVAHGGTGGAQFGICALDVSTGEIVTTAIEDRGPLLEELARLSPREVVIEGRAGDDADVEAQSLARAVGDVRAGLRVNTREAPLQRRDERRLLDVVAPTLDPWIAANALAVRACELALRYVEETGQGTLARHLLPPRAYAASEQLLLDPVTRTHLEITGPSGDLRREGTLLGTVDATRTAAGGRLLLRRLLAPSVNASAIEDRLDRVEALVVDPGLGAVLRSSLAGFPDIERIVARCAAHGFRGRATPRDLARLRAALRVIPALAAALSAKGVPSVLAGDFASADVEDAAALCALLERALVTEPALALGAGPVIARGFDAQMDELDTLAGGGRDRIAALEEDEKKATGIPSLKVRYTSVFGYYIEVTRSHLAKVPAHYKRKQTVANGERYVTEALAKLEEEVEGAESKRAQRELTLFDELVTQCAARSRSLLALAAKVADLDVTSALAEVAVLGRWCRPRILAKDARTLALVDARHPVVERSVTKRGEAFVPSSVELSGTDRQILVVTGPNMAGKSTMMRQVALAQILAQAGSYVPAKSAELSVCDRIFTRVGASDDLSRGRSTFMVEMTETSHILRSATPHSLVLLDEIGRGTSTYDGLSIAWAVAEHIHEVIGSRTLFATHYHELVQLAEHLPRTKNVHVVVTEWNGEIVFVRTLADGAAARSYGIQVARLAGLPPTVVQRAREVLASLEGDAPVDPAFSARLPRHVPRGQASSASAPQMSLFAQPAVGGDGTSRDTAHRDAVIERLSALDVLRMTPLEAMNALAALVEDAKK